MSPHQKVWAQGDCVAFEVEDPIDACRLYRRAMADATIGISTHRPDGIRVREYAKALEDALAKIEAYRLALRGAVAALSCYADRNYWCEPEDPDDEDDNYWSWLGLDVEPMNRAQVALELIKKTVPEEVP